MSENTKTTNKSVDKKKNCDKKFKEIVESISKHTKKAKKKFDDYEPSDKRTITTVLVGTVTLFLALFGFKRHLRNHKKSKKK